MTNSKPVCAPWSEMISICHLSFVIILPRWCFLGSGVCRGRRRCLDRSGQPRHRDSLGKRCGGGWFAYFKSPLSFGWLGLDFYGSHSRERVCTREPTHPAI